MYIKEGAKYQVEPLEEYNKINDLFGLPEYYEDADKMEELMKISMIYRTK